MFYTKEYSRMFLLLEGKNINDQENKNANKI